MSKLIFPEDGYVFKEWSDGYPYPTRRDENVTEDATYIAIFMPIEEDGDLGNMDDEGDMDGEAPRGTQGQGNKEESDSAGEPNNTLEGTGKYEPNNQIINGQTYYREDMPLYQGNADDRIQAVVARRIS